MHLEIRRLICQHNLHFVGLTETRVKEANLSKVRNSVCPKHWRDFSNVSCCTDLGYARIWIFWSPEVSVDILGSSDQHIHCKIHKENLNFLITFCYGQNSSTGRESLWSSLIHCASIAKSPWIVISDFNAIRWSRERKGGAKPDLPSMQSFNNCIDTCRLDDIQLMDPLSPGQTHPLVREELKVGLTGPLLMKNTFKLLKFWWVLF